jgi:RNA polymerase sigma-70 factor, ECF subfamily
MRGRRLRSVPVLPPITLIPVKPGPWTRPAGPHRRARTRLPSMIQTVLPMTDHDATSRRSAGDPWASLPDLLAESETNERTRDYLVTLLYPELKRIAEAHMRRERRDHTLQATALVSEFFVHMARSPTFLPRTRTQFLIVASVAMRRLLVDYARARRAEKRGGERVRVDIENADPSQGSSIVDILEIDELLSKLAQSDPRSAKIVELRFFGGLTNAEIALALGVHERTVKRDWQVARAWLYSHLRKGGDRIVPGLAGD